MITNEAIARRLGLSQLSVGYQEVPGLAAGHQVLVNAYWVLTACPSFAGGWKLGAIAMEDVVDRVPAFRHRWRAFFATDSFVESAELPAERAEGVFAGVEPFTAVLPHRERLGGTWQTAHTLDGISYDLEWENREVRGGCFEFGNPRTESMVALELRFFDLAHEVGRATRSKPVREFLKLWRGYLTRRTVVEPDASSDHPGHGRH